MTALLRDVLVAWVVVTATCSALLVVLVGLQDGVARVRRRAGRRRTGAGVSRAAAPPAPR